MELDKINIGIDEKSILALKELYTKISGYSFQKYDWNKIAESLTGSVYNHIDWLVFVDTLRNGFMLSTMSDELREYIRMVNETVGISEEDFEEKFSIELERSRDLGRNGWIPSEHGNPRDLYSIKRMHMYHQYKT